MTADAMLGRRGATGGSAADAMNGAAGARQAVVVGALALGMFMAALDNSIVNAVLPVVAADFGTDLTAVEWVVVIYLLVQSALLLTFGRLGDIWGHKPVYLAGLAIFVAGSALCGLAPSTPFLVAARALQAGGCLLYTSDAADE